MASRIKNLLGQKRGLWTIVEFVGPGRTADGKVHRMWKCWCSCGTERVLPGSYLGQSKSCGCARQEAVIKHGQNRRLFPRTREYTMWHSMMMRRYNTKSARFSRYGGRGIQVCEEWRTSSEFLKYLDTTLGKCPDGYSLDRINNDGDYEPGNIRYATSSQQALNREHWTKRRVKKTHTAHKKGARTGRAKVSRSSDRVV